MNMKSEKIQCNRVTAEAKKYYWTELCKREVLESKDTYKVRKKVKEMKMIQVTSISYQTGK